MQWLCLLSRFGAIKVSFTPFITMILVVLVATNLTQALTVTWSDHETRLTAGREFDGMSSIIRANDRRFWVFWSRSTNGHFNLMYRTSADEGLTWSQDTQLTSESGDNTGVSALQMTDGSILVAWASSRTGYYEIFCKTLTDLGSWSTDAQLTFNSSRNLRPALCQAANGSIWIVWSSDRSGGYDLYYKISSNYGASWSNSIRLTTDPALDKSPTILQTRDGRLWVFWSSDRTGDYDIFYRTYNGSSWSNPTNLLTSSDLDSNPYAFLTFDNKIYVFWSARHPTPTATDDIYYKYSSDGGITWSQTVQFTSSNYDDVWPTAVQTHDTKIWVTWTSNEAEQPDGNWDIYLKTSLVGDINADGAVDILDLSRAGLSFGAFEGEPEYDADADLNVDGVVDTRDISLVCRNYGAT